MGFITSIFDKLKKARQKEQPVMYYSYYLFGQAIGSPIWKWDNWQKCIPLLNPIVSLASETPFIKTNQSISVQSASYKDLSFGKMVWNDKNNEKWTTKYANEEHLIFFNTEIAFPSRSQCHKNNLNPELFITISNENLTGTKNPKIDQAITLHIKTSIIQLNKMLDLEKNIYEIGALLNWKIAGKITRPTAYKFELGGYTDSFWDGAFGVLAGGNEDFSNRYKKYGIQRLK